MNIELLYLRSNLNSTMNKLLKISQEKECCYINLLFFAISDRPSRRKNPILLLSSLTAKSKKTNVKQGKKNIFYSWSNAPL